MPLELNLYQQERGGRLLLNAVQVGGKGHTWSKAYAPTHDPRALGLLRSARDILQGALGRSRSSADAYRLLGRVRLLLGNPQGAVAALETYTELRPYDPAGHQELALAYEAQHRTASEEAASTASRAWKAAGYTASDLIELGIEAHRMEQYEDALAWYRRATLIAPASGDGWYHQGLAYEQMERWEQALQAFQKALSKSTMSIAKSSAYYHSGWLLCCRTHPPRLEEALAALSAALEKRQFASPGEAVRAHYHRAQVLRELGRGREAIEEYERVIAHSPDHYGAMTYLGTLHWQVYGDAARAAQYLERAIDLRPQDKWAYRELVQLYLETGRDAEAINLCHRLLSLDREDEWARSHLEQLEREGRER
jgi:tetratricopeptide (TPR) repeat protein